MSYEGQSGQYGSGEFRPFGSRPGALLSRDSLHVLNFLFKLGLARPAPSQPDGRHRLDGGGRQMNPSIQFDTGGDCNFRVLWEDGIASSAGDTAGAPMATASFCLPQNTPWIAHEYGLKDELDVANLCCRELSLRGRPLF